MYRHLDDTTKALENARECRTWVAFSCRKTWHISILKDLSRSQTQKISTDAAASDWSAGWPADQSLDYSIPASDVDLCSHESSIRWTYRFPFSPHSNASQTSRLFAETCLNTSGAGKEGQACGDPSTSGANTVCARRRINNTRTNVQCSWWCVATPEPKNYQSSSSDVDWQMCASVLNLLYLHVSLNAPEM